MGQDDGVFELGTNGTADSGEGGPPVLLHVDSSPRPASATRTLTAAYAQAWLEGHPGGEIRRHDLPSLNLPHLNATEMGAWFAEPGDHTELHQLVLARSNTLIDDVLAADELIIGAPMWNFSIPSSLKAWIDHVVKAGRTIAFGEHGPIGLVTAKRATVVSSRGSEYRTGTPMAALDLQEPYLRQILGFLGIADVRVVNVDHQGPNYPDGPELVEDARVQLVAMASDDVAALA